MAARRVLLLSSPLCERSRICPLLNTTPPTASLLLPEQFLLSKSHRVQYSSDATRDKGPPSTSAGRVSCRLESRGVVAVSGPDAFHFMQGLVTNDLAPLFKEPPPSPSPLPTPNEPTAMHPPLYAAMLTPQGRMLYDLFLYRPPEIGAKLDRTGAGPEAPPSDAPQILVDVDASCLDEFLSQLKRYKLRAKVSVEPFSGSLSAWASFNPPEAGNTAGPSVSGLAADTVGWGGGTDNAGQASAETDASGHAWHADPRLPLLGLRGLFQVSDTPPLVEADSTVSEDEYRGWRFQHGVAEGSVEIPKGEALPLEFNLDGLAGVSFEKGCYVGQELTARTHHRGVVRKRVMPVRILGQGYPDRGSGSRGGSEKAGAEAGAGAGAGAEAGAGAGAGTGEGAGAEAGAEVVEARSGKTVGRILAVHGAWGLAHLRLPQALAVAEGVKGYGEGERGREGAGGLVVKGDRGKVVPVRPGWWPHTWGHEEGA